MTRIIRSPATGQPLSRSPKQNPEQTRVVRAALLQSLAEADHILAEAKNEAQRLRQQAQAEAIEIKLRAAEEGRAQATGILAAAAKHAADQLAASRDELTHLAVRIAEKLIGEQLRLSPDTVIQLVRECLKHSQAHGRILVRVNPLDLPLIQAALPSLQTSLDVDVLMIQPDAAVQRGGCLLETEVGQIDGQLQSQLQAIQEALER